MAEKRSWTSWRVRVGYPVALVYLWLASPTTVTIAAGIAVAFLGLLLRASAAGYLRKGETLATSGPYARTRNPLYLGSALLAFGFVVAGDSWIAGTIVAAYFLVFYPVVMRREEAELRSRFGPAFASYAANVPLFWPRVRADVTGNSGPRFSRALYLRNREYNALIGFLVGVALLVLRMKLPWR